ncbi:MAG: type II toxin-antitoxin system RelE/ParE family toxin [Deltaproteobacteria bacterium]|nr:type II toxin-antitoxin system RelE/ParE family toxin [Deltaproteobacteria bacterium]
MSREIVKKEIDFYRDNSLKRPVVEWLESLEIKTQARIRHRLARVENGNLGDCFPVGEGVMELRFFFGPGYRVYFGEAHESLIILLCGGDKKSQGKDIERAKEYWRNYKKRLK